MREVEEQEEEMEEPEVPEIDGNKFIEHFRKLGILQHLQNPKENVEPKILPASEF